MTLADVDPAAGERVLGQCEGGEPGPTLVIVGGLHANEPAGLEAAERVLDGLRLSRGSLVVLRGNLAALATPASEPWLRPRYIDRDLNRMFLAGGEVDGARCAESIERRQLIESITAAGSTSRGRCCLLDLHTVSADSPAFIAFEDSLPARRFAMRFPLPKVLGMEEELPGLLMDYVTQQLGYLSLIVEAGRHDDPDSVRIHEAVIRVALDVLGLTRPDHRSDSDRAVLLAAARGRGGHVYDVRYRAPIRHADFRALPTARAFLPVCAGSTRVAIEAGRAVSPPETGLLFMPNRQPHPREGDDAYFVVRRVGRVWLGLSACLRSRRTLHRILPRLFPGVRRRPGRPDELLVAPEVAAVLRRQIFHLLGYRLLRFSPAPHLSAPRRAGRAALGLARAVWLLVRGTLHGGERAFLESERETDWIVRRRRLDSLPPRVQDADERC